MNSHSNHTRINPLRPNSTIWRHGSTSTLARIMTCCLPAWNHHLNQCWIIISTVSNDIHLRASLAKISLKITYIKFHSNQSGVNELAYFIKTLYRGLCNLECSVALKKLKWFHFHIYLQASGYSILLASIYIYIYMEGRFLLSDVNIYNH